MKIAVAALALPSASDHRKAGVGRFCYCLIEAMLGLEARPELEVYVPPGYKVPESWQAAPRAEIRHAPWRYNIWHEAISGLTARHRGIDVWYSISLNVPRASAVPRAYMVHDLFAFTMPEAFDERALRFYRAKIPFACSHAERIVTNSEATKRDVMDRFARSDEEVAVVPLGPGNVIKRMDRGAVDREVLEGLGVPFKRYLLLVSTLEPRKNFPRFLRAFASVRDEPEAEGVGVVVVGAKGWKYESTLSTPDELGIAERVAFLGYVPDETMPLLFAGCEAFVCPSISEGFGMPLLEAMGAGVPVISSRGGALPEVGGDAVRYFDPLSESEMGEAVLKVLEASPDERASMVEAGLQQASKFSWTSTAEATFAALEPLASNRR